MVCHRKKSLILVTGLAVLGIIYLQARTHLRLTFLTPADTTQRNPSVRQNQRAAPVPRYTVLKSYRHPAYTDGAEDGDTVENMQFLFPNYTNSSGASRETQLNESYNESFNESYREALEKLQRTEKEQRSRLNNLKSRCHELVTYRKPIVRGNITDFYYSRDYNFAYCKVPKSGSTLWTKLFMALLKGDKFARGMSRWSRAEIHAKSKILRTSPVTILRGKVPTIVVSRNPYTRLYSAYVDKAFLPLFWERFDKMAGVKNKPFYFLNYTQEVLKGSKSPINQRLSRYRDQLLQKGLLERHNVSVKVTPICANNVTFEEFLSFVIADSKRAKILEPHWAPISHLCHPCKFNTFRVVKQESFTEDVEYTLRSVNVDLDNFPSIQNTLHGNRAENSIPSIISVVQSRANFRTINECISQEEIIHRVWKSLQIQGFIKDSVPFPKALVGQKVFNKFLITDAILETIKNNPMTSQEKEQQRNDNVVNAYKNVDKGILDQIASIYHMDFVLFNYSTTPPS